MDNDRNPSQTNRLALFDDLAEEGAALERLVVALPDRDAWLQPSAARGWTIAHQIGHLAWTDRVSLLALRDHAELAKYQRAAEIEGTAILEAGAAEGLEDAGPALLRRWRTGRERLVTELAMATPDVKVPWFGPPMKPASMASARIMETFAHGQDVADALGVNSPVTPRVRHVCHLGVRTRNYAYAVRGAEAPTVEFRVELDGVDGETWSWGPDDATQSVSGSALDFALLVTQRRHRDDLDLIATGPDADRWLDIAQAFAGPPGAGRKAARLR